jgi:hypothetical protein
VLLGMDSSSQAKASIRGSSCPQVATRAVSSTLTVMAGLRGKRQRRELAKALVGVLLVRAGGSICRARGRVSLAL